MEEIEVKFKSNNQSLFLPQNLLMKQIKEIKNNIISLPDYIMITDLNLYINFLNTGYIKTNNIQAVLTNLIVADFFSQQNICNILTSSIIIPALSVANCLNVLTYLEEISPSTYSEVYFACMLIISSNFDYFIDFLHLLPKGALECLFEELYQEAENREIIFEKIKEVRKCSNYIELLIDEEKRLESSKIIPELEMK